ncbi:protein TIPIN homolog [Brevipalpus obovatus]|uniref:protein TIPIN homolog n=1 Tax=Brevipalpus obovatus TaxID=246614 RepID=UPI003D9DC426
MSGLSFKGLIEKMKSPDGLAVLPDVLQNIHYRGDGREQEYLNKIIYQMEQWANKLCPRVKFDDFVEKTEMISTRKQIKTFVTKIRYGMPLDIIDPNRSLIPEEIDESDDDLPQEGGIPQLDDFPDLNEFPELDDLSDPHDISQDQVVPGPSGFSQPVNFQRANESRVSDSLNRSDAPLPDDSLQKSMEDETS